MSDTKIDPTEKKLGLIPLSALIIGSMLGGGAFALPQNIAERSSAGAILIGWIITSIGMFSLATVFKYLSDEKPQLKNGIYSYAKQGFGNYIGFNSAWGYWLSALFGNVSYAVLMFSALGYFFPIFGDGNNLASIVSASVMVWLFHWIVSRGVHEAIFLNLITTIAKLIPIFIFILCALVAFHWQTFTFSFWGKQINPLGTQIKDTMLVTLWVFIGIEGAVVVSSRAKKRSDISKATYIGLFGTLVVYILISLLSLGIIPQAELAVAKNPSLATVLEHIVGSWGAILAQSGLIISLLGAWLGWTILCIQVPYDTALDKAMPPFLAKTNHNQVPIGALWLTSVLIQLSLVMTFFSNSTYLAIIKIATSCILIPYFLSSLFAFKIFILRSFKEGHKFKPFYFTSILLSCCYSIWLVIAAGLYYLSLSAILYAIGLVFYVWAKRHEARIFNPVNKIIAILLVLSCFYVIYSCLNFN